MKIGDKVRKAARRNHRGSSTLGVVTELIEERGKTYARVASGERRTVSTVWLVKQLIVITEEEATDVVR